MKPNSAVANVGDDRVYLPGPSGIRGEVDVIDGTPWKVVKEGYDWLAAGYQIGDLITIIDPDEDEDPDGGHDHAEAETEIGYSERVSLFIPTGDWAGIEERARILRTAVVG